MPRPAGSVHRSAHSPPPQRCARASLLRATSRDAMRATLRLDAASHPQNREKMSWFSAYTRSSIGTKHIMAVTGLLLFLFAIVHMLGHLQMFGGPEMYNAYAHFLQELWEVKWPTRIALLAFLIIHAVLAIGLVSKN